LFNAGGGFLKETTRGGEMCTRPNYKGKKENAESKIN